MSHKTLLAAALCALAIPLIAHAAPTNGNFETGDLTGWTSIGLTGAATSSIGVTPTEGTYQAYVDNTGNGTVGANIIAAALGLSGPDILALGAGAPTVGSAIYQDVSVSAGDTLYFDWNFITDELDELPQYNDFAFFSVDSAAFLLASRNSSTYDTVSPPLGFDGQTDWSTQTYTFTSSGTVRLGFVSFDVYDAGHDSWLLLDAMIIPAPEPSTLALLAAGLPVGLFLLRRRRKRA